MPQRFTTRDRTLAWPTSPSWMIRCWPTNMVASSLGLQGGEQLTGEVHFFHGGDQQQGARLLDGDLGAFLQGRVGIVPQQVG